MSDSKPRILVTGATDQIGGALMRLLAGESDLQAIAAVRRPGKAKGLGVPVVTLDYDREETLAPALEGIDSVFMAGAQVLLHDSAAR